jgi:predicted phosphohydrolase
LRCGEQPVVSQAQLDYLRLSLAQTATQSQSWSIVVGHHPPISGSGPANTVLNNAVSGLLAQGK